MIADRAVGAAAGPHRRPAQGDRRRQVRLRVPGSRTSATSTSCRARSPRAASPRSTPARRRRAARRHHRADPRERAARGSPDDEALRVLQTDAVAYHGQIVAAVVAQTLGDRAPRGRPDRRRRTRSTRTTSSCAPTIPASTRPSKVNAGFATDTDEGDVEAALAARGVRDRPHLHHAALPQQPARDARHAGGLERRRRHPARQQPGPARRSATTSPRRSGCSPSACASSRRTSAAGSAPRRFTHPHVILTVMAAQAGRPAGEVHAHPPADVLAGRLPHADDPARAAGAPTRDGRLTAIAHEVVEQTSTRRGVRRADRGRDPHDVRRAQPPHDASPGAARRADALDLPRAGRDARACTRWSRRSTRWRSPAGSTRSSSASATSRTIDPDTKHPFSSRGLVACLREGAQRFGWEGRDPDAARAPRRPLAGRHRRRRLDLPDPPPRPRRRWRGSTATATTPSLIDASDIGTGTWTALTQIAADALDVAARAGADRDRRLARCRARPVAGGSMGIVSWGSAIVDAAHEAARAAARRATAASFPPTGSKRDGETDAEPRGRAALDARLRRAVRRGAGRRRHRRGARAAPAGRVRRRPHHQPQDRPLAAAGRDDDGALDGAARGDGARPALRPLRQPRPGRVPHRDQRRRRRRRGPLDRRARPARQPDGRQGHRRDRHGRHRRRDRQRRPPRHRRARPRPADPAGQAARGARANTRRRSALRRRDRSGSATGMREQA